MRRLVSFLSALMLLLPVFASAALYRYQDERGKAYFTNDYMAIPEEYHASVSVLAVQGVDTRAPSYPRGGEPERKKKYTHSLSSPLGSVKEAVGQGGAVSSGDKPGWLALHRSQLEIAGAIALALGGFLLVGKLASTMPRQLALIIKVALVAALGTYLLKANAERFASVIGQVKEQSNVTQKMIDTRSEAIKKQAE